MMEHISKLASIICLLTISMNGLEGCPAMCFCNGTTVDCSNQGLTEIPSDIPTNTTILRLDENQLTYVGNDSFTGLSNLTVVYLNSNRIEEVEAGAFTDLCRLRILFLHSNSIRALPNTVFHGLRNLLYLYLYSNKLSCLHQNLFWELRNLYRLYLHYNDIFELPTSIFRGLGKLLHLSLSGNWLNVLDENVFNGLDNLIRVDLEENNLKTLPENIFHGLNRLSRLFIYSNDITTLPGKIFEDLNNLKYLYMYRNPWSCDCRLREQRAWLDDNSYRLEFGNTMVCESPDHHHSMSILDVSLANLTCYPIPVFYTPSKTIIAEIGDDVILDCEVESELEVDKYWMIPNGTVIHQSTDDVCSDYGIVQQGDGSLVIPFAEVDDEGLYSCVASNLEGTTLGVRFLKINRTSSHVTTETMSTTDYATVSGEPDMVGNSNVTVGILAFFLGVIASGLCVVAFFAVRYYRRAKPKRSDDNDSYANHKFGSDSSEINANQVGYYVERSEAVVKNASRENQGDRHSLPPRMFDKDKQQQQVYENRL